MIRSIVLATIFWLEMLVSMLLFLIALILEFFSDKVAQMFVYHVIHNWSKHGMWLAGVKIEVRGTEHLPVDNRIGFVSNHQSYLDIPILLAAIPKPMGFIAKSELRKVPFINQWMRVLRCILVDRKNSSESIEAIHKRIRLAEKGHPLVLFPEGTRAKNGKMRRFKTGGVHLYYEAGLTLVPVTIDGSFRLFEAQNKLKPGKVVVTIHPCIQDKKNVAGDYKEMTKLIQDTIESGFQNS